MRLRTKLITTIGLVLLISLSIAGLANFYFAQKSMEKQIISDLESTADTMALAINFFLDGYKDKIRLIATHKNLSIEELKEINGLGNNFYEIFVLDNKGIIILSSNESHIGLDKSTNSYFTNAREETYIKPIYFSDITHRDSLVVSTPFQGGVLAARIDLGEFDSLVSNRIGFGDTEEGLLAYKNKNGDAVFFTDRLFADSGRDIISGQNLKIPITQALLNNEGVFLDYNDYRGTRVVAVTRYLEDIEIGLVVKIDYEEAFRDVENLKKVSIVVVLILFVLIGIIIYFITKSISRDIEKLTLNVDKVSKGDFNTDIEVKSSISEIKSLEDAMNRIMVTLKLAVLKQKKKE